MTAKDKTTLKSYFNTGDIPTETDFANLIDSLPDVYNVKAYGAVGNGTTDDTIAIQAAINAAFAAGGGRVFIPSGRYLLTASLVMKSGVTISGIYPGSSSSEPLDWSSGFTPDSGTVITYPGGTVFTQDTSTGINLLSMLSGVMIESLGFDNVGTVISCGAQETMGLMGPVIRDLICSDVTGFVLDLTNLQLGNISNIRARCVQFIRITADHTIWSPSNSTFIDCFAFILPAGDALPAVHLRTTERGVSMLLAHLHFIRLQVNRFLNYPDAGSAHLYLEGVGDGRLVDCTFDDLDFEGAAEYQVKGSGIAKCKFNFTEMQGTVMGCIAALQLRTANTILIDSLAYALTVDLDATVTECYLTGKMNIPVGAGYLPLGLYSYDLNGQTVTGVKTAGLRAYPTGLDVGAFWSDRGTVKVVLTTTETPSYTNAGGHDMRMSYTTPPDLGKVFVEASNGVLLHANAQMLLDGDYTTGPYPANNTPIAGEWMRFDFPGKVLITEAIFYESVGNAQGTVKWQLSVDNDGTWVDIGSPFTLGGATVQTQTELAGNVTYALAYRMLGISGNTNWSDLFTGIDFKIANL